MTLPLARELVLYLVRVGGKEAGPVAISMMASLPEDMVKPDVCDELPLLGVRLRSGWAHSRWRGSDVGEARIS